MTLKKALRWLIPALWLVFVIFLSCQTGSESEKTTTMLAKTAFPVFALRTIYPLLRLGAHFGVHFVLSIFIYQATRYEMPQPASIALICGSMVAVFDEVLQLFIAGRIFEFSDISLNLIGIFAGIVICVLLTPQQRAVRF